MPPTPDPTLHLKKITLALEAGRAARRMDLTAGSATLVFIFGTGAAGLTPFEYELAARPAGETFVLRVAADGSLSDYFRHLSEPLRGALGDLQPPFYLKGRIADVAVPTSREIVRALAQPAHCKDHDCGAGCCGH